MWDHGPRAVGRLRQSLIFAPVFVAFLLLTLSLALLPLRLAMLLVGGVVVATLALINPIWALYVAVLSVPVQELVHLPGGLSVTQAAFVLAGGTWALRLLAYPYRPVVFGRVAFGLVLLLWVLLLASLTTPYSAMEGLKETLRWGTVALIYLLTLNMLVSEPTETPVPQWHAVGLVGCLLLAPTANALLGLWQFMTGSAPASFAIAQGDFSRAYGTIGQPNSFAGYLNMTWPLAVALALGAWKEQLTRRHARREVLLWAVGATAAAGLLLAALGASLSRGGWVGAMGGTAVMGAALLVSQGAQVRRYAVRLVAVAAAGAMLVLIVGSAGLLPAAATARVESIVRNLRLFDVRTVNITPDNFAVVERMAHLQAGWAMLKTYPITGVGPGNFSLAYEGRGAPGLSPFSIHPWYTSQGHAHNYYLHLAAETGVLGLLAYLLLLGLLVVQGYISLRRAEGWFWQSIAIGGCGVIGAVATHNIFENLHVLNMGVQLGAAWGLLAAIEQHRTPRCHPDH